ncbi:GFA family protein [Polaromonas sp. SM01]|uniref:GFA family protein n=1 Tax=Polaromonas sp. SM01 TaxID=3085630 RepID=UPI0029822C95|nr:GFA family protein [Polaromonas sp. SM01]MDW5441166.1 GFA family protein [Polaromonas sp. SM01]
MRANTYRCNCSICSRNRFWPAIVAPGAFRLLSGQSDLTKYLFNTRRNEHYFCKHCGVRPFGIGRSPEGHQIYGVNLGCLDDVTPKELAAVPIIYVDGKHDNWSAAPLITSYL